MTTTDIVIELRIKYQCASLQFIGDKCGVTRERVRQILSKANMITDTRNIKRYQLMKCLICDRVYIPKRKWKYQLRGLCSYDCLFKSRNVDLVCDYCGSLVSRPIYRIIYQAKHIFSSTNKTYSHTFCNKKCQALYMVKKRGNG